MGRAYQPIRPLPRNDLLFQLLGANMNSTADQIFEKVGPFTEWFTNNIWATNASLTLSVAVGGIYPAASKAGTAIIAAAQAWSGLAGPNVNGIQLSLPSTAAAIKTITPYLSLTTPQGAAATCDIYIFGLCR